MPIRRRRTGRVPLIVAVIALAPWDAPANPVLQSPAGAPLLDLRNAVIVTADQPSARDRKAVQVFVEEVEQRTLIRLAVSASWPEAGRPAIAVGRAGTVRGRTGADLGSALGNLDVPGPEGYRLVVQDGRATPDVVVLGTDERGVLFGVGRLLRELRMSRGQIGVRSSLRISTTPETRLRGHQLGYRPKTNSYDGWTVPMWDQYIRELAIFGSNALELMPPRTDDAADSPHFPLPQMPMMVEMSRIADEYGLDVWLWYPALDPDYNDPKQVQAALEEWGNVFKQLPRVDVVFVPGGDPGHTPPATLFALLERQTEVLRRYHPRAQMWLSPQGFTDAWMDEFYQLLRAEPEWLGGIVFGPQVRDSLPTLRAKVPTRYPIRRYPDITHSLRSQYPVPHWDLAHALTSGREPINPRPVDQTIIYRALQEHAVGFLTYSEGCNDDVNKIIWSGLGWDSSVEPLETLREYSRFLIGDRYADTFAHGLLALERNWRGPLLANTGIETTLQQFRAMEEAASPGVLLNWRFQQALYRAYYDAYQQRRLLRETALEERAMDSLRLANRTGSAVALDAAARVLREAETDPVATDLRRRVSELAEALFQSIRMQLSVERYQAISVGRGATLDTVDAPLNNRLWLEDRFQEIRSMPKEEERLEAIAAIVRWTDPGPGGFYDDLGKAGAQPHLVTGAGLASDPGAFASPRVGFGYRPGWRTTWMTHAESFYDAPLEMRYEGLDPAARYRVRVVYAGDVYSFKTKIGLVADQGLEVHPPMPKEQPPRPVEFDVPYEATRDGSLTLRWTQERGAGGAGRGTQIGEVWLIRAPGGGTE